jgi:hypothetical protein
MRRGSGRGEDFGRGSPYDRKGAKEKEKEKPSIHPKQTEGEPFDVGQHPCTGYHEGHRESVERTVYKGSVKTKAPDEQLDAAVVAINSGEATYVENDGRNDYVVYNGYRYGVHRQVFEGKRSMFPVGPE